MRQVQKNQTLELLQTIMEFELAGAVRYTHYSLMVTGENRDKIVDFLKEQASESLTHAQLVGEMLTSVNGKPTLGIAPIEEIQSYSVKNVLVASIAHEKKALEFYQLLMLSASDNHVAVAEFARNMIEEEGSHHHEMEEMLANL